MFQIRPPVQMTTPTKGSGTMTVMPAPAALSFDQAGIPDGATVSYRIEDGSAHEIGTGTYSAINGTLTRTVQRSTNENRPLNLSGTARVYTADTVDFLSLVRSEIPARQIPVDSFMVAGHSKIGDLGAGAIYSAIGATPDGLMAIRDASGRWFNLVANGDLQVGWFGVTGDGADTRAAFQTAINAAAAAKRALVVPGGRYKLSDYLELPSGIVIRGAGVNVTRFIGTAGKDAFRFKSGHTVGNVHLEGFEISGAENCIVSPDPNWGATFVSICDVQLNPRMTGVVWKGDNEEWYLRNVSVFGGQYGFWKQNVGPNPVLDKSTFVNIECAGQTVNGWRLEGDGSSSALTWINLILTNIGQHGFRADTRGDAWAFINATTENAAGYPGKAAHTTGSITNGSRALTVASAAGFSIGGPITVQGAGTGNADLSTTIDNIAGTTITLHEPASSPATNAAVTSGEYDEFNITSAIAMSLNIAFIGGRIGGSVGARYSINARGIGASLNLLGAATGLVYDPNGIACQFGGVASIREPSNLATEGYDRVSFPTSIGEFSHSIVPSPPGRNVVFVLKDSKNDTTGAFGQFQWRLKNPNRSLLASLDRDGGFAIRGNSVCDGRNSVLVTHQKSGAPSDKDMNNPSDGSMVVDDVNGRLWVRCGGTWRYAPLI
jgi:hypothetical protein